MIYLILWNIPSSRQLTYRDTLHRVTKRKFSIATIYDRNINSAALNTQWRFLLRITQVKNCPYLGTKLLTSGKNHAGRHLDKYLHSFIGKLQSGDATPPHRRLVNIGLGNGFVLSVNNTSPEQMLTQFYVAICHRQATPQCVNRSKVKRGSTSMAFQVSTS